jgi:hypothetical protein
MTFLYRHKPTADSQLATYIPRCITHQPTTQLLHYIRTNIVLFKSKGQQQLNQYSNSLQAERSGNRITVEARFSAPIQTGPGAHPSSYTMGTRSLSQEKVATAGIIHPHQSSAEVTGRVELYLYSHSGPS